MSELLVEDRAARIVRLFPLVRILARRVNTIIPGAELDELIGDGSIGLIRAVDTYRPTRGASLDRYVRRVVVGAMLNGLRRLDPVSERARREIREAERERYGLAQERGTLPTMGEMERRRRRLRAANAAVVSRTPLSLDAPFPPGIGYAERGLDPADAVVEAALGAELEAALTRLPPRERRVVDLHYRLEVPLRTVGRELAVSSQRASQLHLAALGRLRRAIPG